MGRKSKKKGKAKGARTKPAASINTPDASNLSGECWICLDGGPDDAGQPLVRECSCRGDAGFAHLSCLVEYAEQKCDVNIRPGNVVSTIDPSWTEPFKVCPNCKQEYRSKLAIDLATACVDFVEREKPDCLWSRALALQMKLGANVVYGEYSAGKVEECGRTAEECFSVINQLKSNPYGSLMSILEGDVYMLLGCLHLERGNESGGRKAVEYYEKAKEIDGQGAFASADMRILEAKALFEGGEGDDEEEDLAENVKSLQLHFQEMVKVHGEGSPEAIIHGRKLVAALKDVHRAVEAERLMTKIYTLGRRVHGPDHITTKVSDQTLQDLRVRLVVGMHDNRPRAFQALRYEDSGKTCVVQGPIECSRDAEKEITGKLDAPILPNFGTPVICHGLKSAPELNGKVGDVRGEGTGPAEGRLIVHLEGRKKPILVKPENLRIAFELPEPAHS